MKETTRISNLFDALYDGTPWIDVTITGTLQTINHIQAAVKIAEGRNSIWQIVNHMILWRENVLQRVQGEVIDSPADNYFEEINNTSEDAWQATLQRLKQTRQQWALFLKDFNKDNFEKKYSSNNLSYYEHIHGIIQHDAYHLGQIVLLSKLI